MENLKKEMKFLIILLIITIGVLNFINTIFLLSRIQELENKIEVNRTFKSE
jgi:hypothetical protein